MKHFAMASHYEVPIVRKADESLLVSHGYY